MRIDFSNHDENALELTADPLVGRARSEQIFVGCDAATRAQEIDWDFPSRTVGDALEGVHPYPAKFIREIPGTLIDLFPPQAGTIVFDPFCGSGTTLVEAQRRGFQSVGVDLNPIACLMSRVKTAALANGLAAAARNANEWAQKHEAPIPNIPNLDHWFQADVQAALASLAASVERADAPHQDALRVALSSIVVRVSRQESDTRYAAIDKNVDRNDVFKGFIAAATKLEEALHKRSHSLVSSKVLERDALSLTADDIGSPVGLVVTSPPYPNAYEYWLYHKYRMFWLGFDPIAVKSLEIGARAHFFKKNRHTAEHFSHQMDVLLALLEKVIVADGHICIVVGRSIIHGKQVDNARDIEALAQKRGFKRAFVTERKIAATRKAFNLSHANIKTETILVMRRT
ncbi:MAG: RNA methyltransferase [Hyphomicrobiaceae bacterium]|nr:RNA methyltransferase [Hyphomicrobiaceae bacterium]